MTRLLALEEFDDDSPTRQKTEAPSHHSSSMAREAAVPDNDMLEKSRLEGYESGYQAGWDDAARSQAEDQSRIGAEFARNLQDLGFTFHEARAHVMHALEPLLTGIVEKVLPRLIAETIGQTIIEELLPLASTAADAPIEVVVSPDSRPVLETMLSQTTSIPVRVVEEATLAEGQVFLRSGKAERHIDLTGAVDRIGMAINDLYELNDKAFRDG
jgi:flagellar biosynthesis/type III secretory pathway protein FliH